MTATPYAEDLVVFTAGALEVLLLTERERRCRRACCVEVDAAAARRARWQAGQDPEAAAPPETSA